MALLTSGAIVDLFNDGRDDDENDEDAGQHAADDEGGH